MLYWALIFFVLGLITAFFGIAAFFGFGGAAAAGTVGIAKILFFAFIVLAILSLLFGSFRRSPV